jgi:hypothetical protein
VIKIFMCGASAQLERCEEVVFALRRFAIVTTDWPAQVRRDRDAGLTDHDLTRAQREMVKRDCLRGIREADVVLWLASSSGAAYEAGYAEALGKPVVIVGPSRHPIYGETVESELRFDRDEDAIAYLADKAIRHMRRSA